MDFHPVEANLRQSFRVVAAGRPNADILELPGITIASAGVAFQMFNAAFLSSPVDSIDDLDRRIRLAHNHFAARGIPWSFWFCEGWLRRTFRWRLSHACMNYWLRLSGNMPGMISSSLRKGSRVLPAMEFRRVDNAAALGDFRGIGSLCFHVPTGWFAEVFDDALPASRPDFACWVGYEFGEPVATAATLAAEGALGIYNVAVVPDRRGRGFAEAITRHAIASAANNSPVPLILQASSMGESLYERLGFREVTRILVYNSVTSIAS